MDLDESLNSNLPVVSESSTVSVTQTSAAHDDVTSTPPPSVNTNTISQSLKALDDCNSGKSSSSASINDNALTSSNHANTEGHVYSDKWGQDSCDWFKCMFCGYWCCEACFGINSCALCSC